MSESLLDTATLLLVGDAEWHDSLTETLRSHTDASVEVVETAQAAMEAVGGVDCLITEQTLPAATGVELVERVRVSSSLPVVLATREGTERVASDAVRADVSEYVPVTEPVAESVEAVLERTEQALRSAQRSATRRERARQFDAVFHDTQTATWVLDPDGTLARVNQTARDMIDEAADSLVGNPFWTLPWWASADGIQRDIRRLVETARDGRFGNAVVSRDPNGQSDRIVDLSVRPVENGAGELVSIVVEGIDITEQATLERDLRESERLHRVTLNNMTDTVLITDESGAYTYVCPNVHFIFGYTAAEISEQGSIESLLGADLFDREELAADGVLKNIECTVTDKAGREHTLLVNVREVSIQDGTLLYSCRDVTKRKQREDALATLQETAREFLYAETHQEIAQQMVADVPGVLDLDASGVFLFDTTANELRPAAHSQAMAELHGPLPTVHADGESLTSHSFLEDETLVFEDVHTAERLENRATGLRSSIYIPLGSHGVFLAGTDEVGVLDPVTRELADLLAATAEAAFDRVSRESTLREQDRELQRRNEQLSTLNRINATIREIDQAIVRAETQQEIDHTVCERLTDTDRFEFAWVGTIDAAPETVTPRAWAGNEQGYLDTGPIEIASTDTEPAGQTAATGEVTMVSNVAAGLRDEPWRSNALTRDFLSVLSIPLTYNDFTHGVLTVYADTTDAFDETNLTVMTELGATIAAALSAIERKHALITRSMTRVEFAVDDQAFLLTRLARAADCHLSYQGGIQQTADGDYVFVSVDDADVDSVAETAQEFAAITGVTPLSRTETGGVLQLRLTTPFLAVELADHGAVVQAVTAGPDGTTLVVDVPENIDVRTVAQLLRDTFSAVELGRKQTRTQSTDLYDSFVTKLTDRQLEVIQTAYYGGFFESPRENTGEEIAATLDISPAAFYQHVRTVQRKLFETVLEERGGSAPDVVQ